MDVHQWRRVRSIVERADELAQADRAQWVRDACGADGELRVEVERILAHAGDVDGYLEPDHVRGSLGFGGDFELAPGARAGPYRIERALGAGGMGSVWLAVRDGDFEQRVALKVMRSRFAGASIQKRFRNERAVLASLEHPGIARLIDGGDLADGRPYLAMEYVDGVPIDRWVGEQALDVRARVELFVEVCDAVEHAHRHLVVHRDLKPSNILVTHDGRPKLLDFGIAKVLADSSEGAVDLTRTGEALFTPRYASPEQVRGELVGIASDVYSLGVVLYALLTGRDPYAFETNAPAELVRVITSSEPMRPSEAVRRSTDHPSRAPFERDPTRLESNLRGDLDNILLVALRKEPERRYGSVEQLSRDLRRYLDDLPVSARPDTLRYRCTKFTRRNRAAVLAAALVLVTLLAGLTASLVLYREARRAAIDESVQRGIAQSRSVELARERDRAEAQAYVANIAAAEAAIRSNDVADAERRLARAPDHLRNWEWRHLQGRLDRSVSTFSAHDIAYGLAFEPHGALLATCGADGTVKLWDRATCKELETIAEEGVRLEFVTFSPGGDLLVWPGPKGTLRVWDMARRGLVASVAGHAAHVHAAAFLPDGRTVVTAAFDGSIRISDARTGELQRRISSGDAQPGRIAIDRSGTLVAFGASDHRVRVHRIDDGALVRTFDTHGVDVRPVAFDPDGTRIVVGSSDGTASVFDLATGEEVRKLVGHTALVDGAVFLPDGKRVVTASWDRTLRIWDVDTGRERTVLRGHHGNICALAIDAAGATLASGESGGAIRLWSVEAEDVRTIHHEAWNTKVDFLDDGRLVFGDRDCVRVFDPATGRDVERLVGGAKDKDRFAVALGESIVACAVEGECSVELWSLAPSPKQIASLVHEGLLRSIALDRSGTWLASGTIDERVHVWSVADRARIASVTMPGTHATSLEFRPGADIVVAGAYDGTVRSWSVPSARTIAERRVSTSRVNDLAFSRDGARLAAACADGTVRLLDPASLTELAVLTGHGRDVECVAFSPDGTRIASGGADYAIKLWDAASGEEVATLHGHGFTVRSVAFNRDGSSLASQASDSSVRIWDASGPR